MIWRGACSRIQDAPKYYINSREGKNSWRTQNNAVATIKVCGAGCKELQVSARTLILPYPPCGCWLDLHRTPIPVGQCAPRPPQSRCFASERVSEWANWLIISHAAHLVCCRIISCLSFPFTGVFCQSQVWERYFSLLSRPAMIVICNRTVTKNPHVQNDCLFIYSRLDYIFHAFTSSEPDRVSFFVKEMILCVTLIFEHATCSNTVEGILTDRMSPLFTPKWREEFSGSLFLVFGHSNWNLS